MKKKMVMFVAMLMAVVVIAASANAGVLGEDFDSYAVGSNMHGQGGWEGWGGSSETGGIVSLVPTVKTDNVVDISGDSDLCYDQMDYISGSVSFSINQYIPSTSTGATFCILLNEHLSAPSWAMQLEFNLDTGKLLATEGVDDALEDFDILTDQWATIKADIDLDNNTVKVYYEGTLIRDGAFSYDAEPVQLTTLDLFANGSDVVYYDDFSIVGGFDFEPKPADGATVAVADPLTLSWLNLPDPCSPPVLVDVYWDTDLAGNGGNLVLDKETDGLTVVVSAPDSGTYYWKIVATDPNDGGTPYVMEEAVYSVITLTGCDAAKTRIELPYTETDARLLGDTNYDCKVNFVDLAAMAENWLTNVSF